MSDAVAISITDTMHLVLLPAACLFPIVLGSMSARVEVHGSSVCPTSQQVAEKLDPLLWDSNAEPGYLPDRVEVSWMQGHLRVTLFRADGLLLVERDLNSAFSCSDLAEAVAVMVATWELQFHPSPVPPAPQAPLGAAPTAPPIDEKTTPSKHKHAIEIGLGALGSMAGQQLAYGAAAFTAVGAGPLGSWTALRITSARRVDLGAGAADYERLELGTGPRLRWAPGPWLLDVRIEAVGSLLLARGVGFSSDRSTSGFEPGALAGARLAIPAERWAPWLDVSLGGWFRRQQLYVDPIGSAVDLPRFELNLAIGASWLL